MRLSNGSEDAVNAEAEYIRQAIAREDYRQALVQWDDYARRLGSAAGAGILSAGQMGELRALYEWARPALLGARAQLLDQYRQLEAAAAYRTSPASPAGSLRTSG